MISEWDKLSDAHLKIVNMFYFRDTTLRGTYYKVKTEGDKLQEEKRSLLTYGGMMRTENSRLEQKLEAIRKIYDRPNSRATPGEDYAIRLDDIQKVLDDE